MVCPLFPLAPKCHRLWQGCLCHTRDPAAELPVAMKTQHSAVSAELLQHSSRHPLKCSWCVSQEPDWADPILWERTHIVAQQWVCWEETLAVARFQQAVTLHWNWIQLATAKPRVGSWWLLRQPRSPAPTAPSHLPIFTGHCFEVCLQALQSHSVCALLFLIPKTTTLNFRQEQPAQQSGCV